MALGGYHYMFESKVETRMNDSSQMMIGEDIAEFNDSDKRFLWNTAYL